jgi:hypothetical protein
MTPTAGDRAPVMVDPNAATQPIQWIRPRTPWYRRRGMWLAPVLLAVFSLAALVDVTTARDEPSILTTTPVVPTRPPTTPHEPDDADVHGYLTTARKHVPDRVTDAQLLEWAHLSCAYLDKHPTPMGLLSVISAVHNATDLETIDTAYVVHAAVQGMCPRHDALLNN